MANQLLIPQIKPGMLQWTCKVMLIEKHNPRPSKNTPNKHFKPMIFQDAEGNKVQVMTYNEEIEAFGKRLDLYGTYLVSGAVVKDAWATSRVPDLNYPNIWTFNRSTLVQPVDRNDALDHNSLPRTELTPFSALYRHVADNKLIDVMVVVIEKLPRKWILVEDKQVDAAEFIVTDEQCIPVLLTMWESFASIQGAEIEYELSRGNFPVVLMKNVQCALFQGLKFGTRFSSSFEISPNTTRATELNRWKCDNTTLVNELVGKKKYLDSLISLAKLLEELHMKAADLSRHYNSATVSWLKAKFLIPPSNIVDTFIGCDYCSGKINAPEALIHDCMHCGKEKALTIKRFKLGVTITDESGEVNAIIFSYEVEKLLSICGVDNNGGDVDMAKLTKKLEDITFIVGLKKNNKSTNSEFSHIMASLEDVQQLLPKRPYVPIKDIVNASSSEATGEQLATQPPAAKRKLSFHLSTPTKLAVVTHADSSGESDNETTGSASPRQRKSP